MGSWGAELYQNAIAKDVHDRFTSQLHKGKSAAEVTEDLIESYASAINDSDDAPIFWFALADTQWDMACLLPQVKKEALKWLAKGSDIARWEEEDPDQADARAKILKELEEKLSSPSPIKTKTRDNSAKGTHKK